MERTTTAKPQDSAVVTEVVIFRGIVQGVGFRPTVYRIAKRLGMKGRVRNMGGVVQIVCTGKPAEIDAFVREIFLGKPPMAQITDVSRKVIGTAVFRDFSIGQSSVAEDEIAVVPADIAICEDCLSEFYDPNNIRHLHPFISCTNCGPRYTIMNRLPYDRDTTTMDDFPMCDFCAGEYEDPASRRYHAQTISCHNCGPMPLLKTVKKSPVQESVRILLAGGVLALKGVGGYYLACTPFSEEAVQALRVIKNREQKPFAVMFRNPEQIRDYCVMKPVEEALLCSPQRPIVLLEQRADAAASRTDVPQTAAPARPLLASGVCNSSRFVGALLPSFGLQYLLLDAAGPLIMTSANISELPLITDDEKMTGMFEVIKTKALSSRAGGILSNKRIIVSGLDDSVARVIDGEAQIVRRSKGYVPAPVYVQAADALTKDTQIFAAGSHLKSTFALSKGAYSYLSGHLGDMEDLETEERYRLAVSHMKNLLQIEPCLAVCDMHPRYFSTGFAESLGLPLVRAQHHHAHTASVMAEHGLTEPVIGVSFDGTGYGTDGAVWGGEILICEGDGFERFSHLAYTDMIGGDSSMKDARKSAAAYLACKARRIEEKSSENAGNAIGGEAAFSVDLAEIEDYCNNNASLDFSGRKEIAAALGAGVNTVRTSSMGRLFDAVCAMLGIHYENRYEGECAILLENAAQRALTKMRVRETPDEPERLALEFHLNVARAILSECRKVKTSRGIEKVCLSGGVFQNKILTEETLRILRGDGFVPYYNIHVPPNDGGIALGQNFIGMLSLSRFGG